MNKGERLGPVETQVTIKNGIDKNGHLNNAWWGLGFEKGCLDTAAKFGIGIKQPVQKLLINYNAQILRGDTVTVLTFLTEREEGIFQFDQLVQRANRLVGDSSCVYGLYAPTEERLSAEKILSERAFNLKAVFPLEDSKLHHLTALYYFEKGREYFLNTRETDTEMLRANGIRFMVSLLEVRYMQAMYSGQTIRLRTALEINKFLFLFQQELVMGQAVICRGDTICVAVDKENKTIRNREIIKMLKEQLLD